MKSIWRNCNVAALLVGCFLQLPVIYSSSENDDLDRHGILYSIDKLLGKPKSDEITIVMPQELLQATKLTLSFGDKNGKVSVAKEHVKRLLTTTFKSPQTEFLADVNSIKISNISANYFLPQLITLEHGSKPAKMYSFPIDRRLKKNQEYNFCLYDAVLPRDDHFRKQRADEILENQKSYEYHLHVNEEKTKVILAKNLISDEEQSLLYKARVAALSGSTVALAMIRKSEENLPWTSFDSMNLISSNSTLTPQPKYATEAFKTDEWFGLQRLQGSNPAMLRLIKEIPDKIKFTQDMVGDRLGKRTLTKALRDNKIFMVDFVDLKDLKQDMSVEFPAPIGLFHLTDAGNLMPLAIQLQQNPGETYPIFTPDLDSNTWLLAKLYFNLADSNHHEAITHLGNIHFLMDRIIIATHRNLSPSHPVFRLMKPHFLFTLAINKLTLELLLDPESSFSTTLGVTSKGLLYLTTLGLQKYNMSLDGNPHEFFKKHGTTKKIITKYPYRDDIIKSYDIIRRYVTAVLNVYYNEKKGDLAEDYEIQSWRKELSAKNVGNNIKGGDIRGIPGDDVIGFTCLDQLIETVTAIIHKGSSRHAAVNFIQYDYYGYQPNSPFTLHGPILNSTDSISEQYVLDKMPTKTQMADIIIATKVASSSGTNFLGDFEVPALYQPSAVDAVEDFRAEIEELSNELDIINEKREVAYPWGNPGNSPNSISA